MKLIETFWSKHTDNRIEVYENGKGFVTIMHTERRDGSFEQSQRKHRTYAGVEKRIPLGYEKEQIWWDNKNAKHNRAQ